MKIKYTDYPTANSEKIKAVSILVKIKHSVNFTRLGCKELRKVHKSTQKTSKEWQRKFDIM